MKRICLILILSVLICLCSCQTVKDFEPISVGMTQDEVIMLLGNPSTKGFENGKEYFMYNNHPVSIWSSDTIDYRIDFENGVVVGYGQKDYHADKSSVYVYNIPSFR